LRFIEVQGERKSSGKEIKSKDGEVVGV
jgi:hypothetical protein